MCVFVLGVCVYLWWVSMVVGVGVGMESGRGVWVKHKKTSGDGIGSAYHASLLLSRMSQSA